MGSARDQSDDSFGRMDLLVEICAVQLLLHVWGLHTCWLILALDTARRCHGENQTANQRQRRAFCAVYPDGKVCISILHAPGDDPTGYESAAERWQPIHTVRDRFFRGICTPSQNRIASNLAQSCSCGERSLLVANLLCIELCSSPMISLQVAGLGGR